MKTVKTIAAMLLLPALLLGCESIQEGVDAGKEWSYDQGANVRDTICRRSLGVRMDGVAEINSRDGQGWWTATDCDKDGQPDFELDGAGQPVPPTS